MLPCGSRTSRLAQGCMSSAVKSGEPRLASTGIPTRAAQRHLQAVIPVAQRWHMSTHARVL